MEMNEMQRQIGEWADATFVHDAKSIAAHLLEEGTHDVG